MPWQFFLALSIGGEVFGRIVQRIAMKEGDSDPVAYAIVFQLFTGIIIGLYSFLIGFKIPDLLPILPNLLAMPVLYAVANILIFTSLKKMEASLFTILFTTRTIWLILGAIFFLHEIFLPKQFLGALFILGSIVLISWQQKKIAFDKNYLLTLTGALVFATAIINDLYILKSFQVESYLAIAFIAPALLLWILYPKKTPAVKKLFEIKKVKKVALLSVLYGISSLGYFIAYKIGNNAAQIGAIFPISGVLTVLLAILLLNERKGIFVKMIAAILSFIGLLLVQ